MMCDFLGKYSHTELAYTFSDGEGITARELAEIIASGKQDDQIETQGVALEEAMERYASNKSERKRYLRVMKAMVERLRHVEENGYEPLKPKALDSTVAEEEDDDEDVKLRSSSSGEDAKKRKKKKKKQVKREQSELSTATSVPSNATSVKPPVEQKVDPLVTALLGMGFAEEQICAAAKACGGIERATADEMVMWILGGGEESSSSPPPATASVDAATDTPQEPAFIPTSRTSAKPAPTKKPAKQPVANLKRAQKENVEAVKREEEARAVADRLAAKREEQRRRNREWNNRAQARQKEEIELRAQAEAKRIAKERAAAQRLAAAGPVLAGKASAKSAQTRAAQALPAPTQILQRPSHMPVGGIPAGMVASRPYASGPPATAAEPNMMGYAGQAYSEYEGGMAPHVSSGNSVSSAGSGRNVASQYVSSANSVSSAGSGRHSMAAQYVSSANSVSSGGSGMHSAGMLHQPMYGYPSSSVPPPGFQPFGGTPAVSTASSNLSMAEDSTVSFEESGSGEIRATARSFVPTGFKLPAATQASVASALAPVPPGKRLPPTAQQSQPAVAKEDPVASLLSATVPVTATPSAAAAAEPNLNEVIGFDLNKAANHSSLLGSLSLTSANGGVDDTAGSSIWGGVSIAPGPASLPGFGVPADGSASKDGDAADGGTGLWNSGFNQPATSRLGSIW